MKTVCIFIITCFAVFIVNAQKQDSIPTTSILKVDLTQKVAFGDTLEVEFVKVISDSRCPKNVQCVWAGEAKVLVKIYRNGEFEEETQITIHPRVLEASVLELFSSEKTHTKAINLLPYPDASTQDAIPYYLEFCIEH